MEVHNYFFFTKGINLICTYYKTVVFRAEIVSNSRCLMLSIGVYIRENTLKEILTGYFLWYDVLLGCGNKVSSQV